MSLAKKIGVALSGAVLLFPGCARVTDFATDKLLDTPSTYRYSCEDGANNLRLKFRAVENDWEQIQVIYPDGAIVEYSVKKDFTTSKKQVEKVVKRKGNSAKTYRRGDPTLEFSFEDADKEYLNFFRTLRASHEIEFQNELRIK